MKKIETHIWVVHIHATFRNDMSISMLCVKRQNQCFQICVLRSHSDNWFCLFCIKHRKCLFHFGILHEYGKLIYVNLSPILFRFCYNVLLFLIFFSKITIASAPGCWNAAPAITYSLCFSYTSVKIKLYKV